MESANEEKKLKQEIGELINQDRVINFSDAVFAFAATLLVLKIDIPPIENINDQTHIFYLLYQLWPQYLANIISFLIIGFYWLNHHAIFGQLQKYNAAFVWINMVFLIFVAFLPFPIDLYGSFMFTPIIVAFYSASLALVGYMLVLMWVYATRKGLVGPNYSKNKRNYYLARNLIAPLVFTLAIPLVYVDPLLAQFSWLLVIIGTLLVNYDFKKLKKTA